MAALFGTGKPLLFSLGLVALMGCSVRNSGIRGNVINPSCPGKSAGLMLASDAVGTGVGYQTEVTAFGLDTAAQKQPWLGGVLSYKFVLPHKTDNFESPELGSQTCSVLAEFGRGVGSAFRVKLHSGDSCIEWSAGAETAELAVWQPADEKKAAGYIKLKLKNERFATWKGALVAAPKDTAPERPIALNVADYAFSALLNPWIQRDIGVIMPSVAASTAETALPYFCGKTQNQSDAATLRNDVPVPENCIWPHGVGMQEYGVEAVEGESTVADLERLVTQSQRLRTQRATSSSLSKEALAAVQAYQDEYQDLLGKANKWLQYLWLRRIYAGQAAECNTTPETRAGCVRVVTQFFLPDEKAFGESMIAKGLVTWANNTAPADYAAFQGRYESRAKNPYLASLARVAARWVSVMSFMQKEKQALQLAVNLPEGSDSSTFSFESIFPAQGAAVNVALKGAKFELTPKFMTLEFTDSAQKVLRRPVDTGSMILFGNYPVLSLLNNTPQGSDGNTQVPLPSPKSRSGGDSTSGGSSSNCK